MESYKKGDKVKSWKNILISLFIFLLLFQPILSSSTELEDNYIKGFKKKEEASSLEKLSGNFDLILRILSFGNYMKKADSTQNPNGDFLQISGYNAEFDLRPDFYFNYEHLDLNIKPRMNLDMQKWGDENRKDETKWKDDLFINEWLTRIRLMKNLFVSYGRENLQWGPSYLFSPSNPFFDDNGHSNPKQEIPGMDFARLVWLYGKSWTFSLIANLDEGHQEYEFTEFEKTYALKLDYNGQDGYGGLIISKKENDRTRVGAFGGRTVSDALLVYCEGAISKGSNALYPKADNSPFGYSMEPVDSDESSLKNIVLVGGSYTSKLGPTLTVEYTYNQSGYNANQAQAYYQLRRNASEALIHTSPINDLAAFTLCQTMNPRLQFFRENYLMFQCHNNDIIDNLNLLLRWTQNLDDGSGQFISNVEYYIGDHTQLFSIGFINSGGKDTEFGSLVYYQWMFGVEYIF